MDKRLVCMATRIALAALLIISAAVSATAQGIFVPERPEIRRQRNPATATAISLSFSASA